MLARAIKLVAYVTAPRATFAVLHPVTAAQLVKTPFDLRTAYAPRLTAAVTALVVIPLAYRVGKRIGAGALRDRSGDLLVRPHEPPKLLP